MEARGLDAAPPRFTRTPGRSLASAFRGRTSPTRVARPCGSLLIDPPCPRDRSRKAAAVAAELLEEGLGTKSEGEGGGGGGRLQQGGGATEIAALQAEPPPVTATLGRKGRCVGETTLEAAVLRTVGTVAHRGAPWRTGVPGVRSQAMAPSRHRRSLRHCSRRRPF